ncbi:MAG: hypothetical protein JW928_00925 [Candidatus Aureabacteria bacterium]|nr:hypothetical protein [Candidatus Auribacterota bacterium]
MKKKTPFHTNDNYLFWGSFFYTDLAERLFRHFNRPSLVRCREITFDVFHEEDINDFFIIPLKYSSESMENWIFFYLKKHIVPQMKNIFGDDLRSLKEILYSMASQRKIPGNTFSFLWDEWHDVNMERIEGQLNIVLILRIDVKEIMDCEMKVSFPYGYAKERISAFFPNISPQVLSEKSLQDTMAEVSSRFVAGKDKPWNVLDYLRRLRDQEMQSFLYQLMSGGLRDKELSLLLVPLEENVRQKVIVNLSRNIQEEVIYHIPNITFTRLQSKENKVLLEQYKKAFAKADTIILDLLNEGKIVLESFEAFQSMKENFEMSRLMDALQKSDLNKLIKKNYEPLTLQKALAEMSPQDLAFSLSDIDRGALEAVKKNLSDESFAMLREDMGLFLKEAEQKDILKAKARLIKNINRFCSTSLLGQSAELIEMLLHYDSQGKIRNLLFQEIPMEFFARAFQDKDERFFSSLLQSLPDSRKRVFESMLGQIRKTQNSPDVKKASAEHILKSIKALVDKGKMVFFTEDPSKREKFESLLEL